MKWSPFFWGVLLTLWSSLVSAAFFPSQCSSIETSQDFSVSLSLRPALLQETVYITKRNQDGVVVGWTNDRLIRRAAIHDRQTLPLFNYNILLQYEHIRGKRGVLTYYLERNGSWVEIDAVEADVTDLSAAIEVSGINVQNLACSEEIEFPEAESLNLCEYFPDPIQSNRYVLGVPFFTDLVIGGDRNKLYLPTYSPISFSSVATNPFGQSGCVYGSSSSVSGCLYNPFLSYANFPPQLATFIPSSKDVFCTNSCTETLSPGAYRTITIGSNGSTVTLSAGEYWINTLNFSTNDAKLNVTGQVVLHYKNLLINGDRVKINSEGNADNLVLIGHGTNSGVTIYNNDVSGRAHWYVDPDNLFGVNGIVSYADRFNWRGAITATRVRLGGHDSQISAYAPQSCALFNNNYAITMSPNTDISLMCGDERPEFLVRTTNNALGFSTQVNVEVFDSSGNAASGVTLVVADGVGSGSGSVFTSNSEGRLRLQVVSDNPALVALNQSYSLKVTMAVDNNQADVSTFRYVPFKFAVDDQQIIAGQEITIDAQVLACDVDGGQVVASNYAGSPQVTQRVDYPSSADGGIEGVLSYQPQFNQGRSTASLTHSEAGQFTVTLQDSRYDCSEFASCPVDGSGVLQGSFTLYSRPWTFAICGDNLQRGTSESGLGMVAAGEGFDLIARPIRFTTQSDNRCNLDLVTQNYFYSDASIDASYSLDTPESGVLGALSSSRGLSQVIGAADVVNQGYLFNQLRYDDVGSIDFHVTETGSFYANILQGIETSQTLGRFYPAQFRVLSNEWGYPGTQSFIYMNQPFESVDYQVEALNAQFEPVQNYPLFNPGLQAQFDITEPNYDDRFSAPRMAGTWQQIDGRSVGAFTQSGSDDCLDGLCWRKLADFTPDGPFNMLAESLTTDLQLTGDLIPGDGNDNQDPVNFAGNDNQFLIQPDIRFGRARLESVGGLEDQQIQVPLSVEYWNGQQFEKNVDDDSTSFNGEHFCSQLIWSEGGSGAYLSGSGRVSSGSFSSLLAQQTVVGKQQVRFWLRLGFPQTDGDCVASTNVLPWLRYDWAQAQTDEQDPSAVVTFGLYRGNDKVIFRGERGMTGQ